MEFEPYIENRSELFRKCNCGEDHDIKIIQGLFYYSEQDYVAFSVALIEHSNEKHIWVSFITGEWPDTNEPDCYVTAHIWSDKENRIMQITDSVKSPFGVKEIFECYPVTREQVIAVDGAKDWFINTYLQLFQVDHEIGNFIENSA
ncbi:MAG: hypothetical protein GY850_36415 [bacterium]|nr:hypothetical protein [bacterium]